MHSIGTASKLSGVHIETIRYYEREHVIPAPPRAANGRRLFDDAAISTLGFIKQCRMLGFRMNDIRALTAIAGTVSGECPKARAIGAAHLAGIRRKIRELESLETFLAETIDQCGENEAPCPLIRSLSDTTNRS